VARLRSHALPALVLLAAALVASPTMADQDHHLAGYPFLLDYELGFHRVVLSNDVTLWPSQGPFTTTRLGELLREMPLTASRITTARPPADHMRFFALTSGRLINDSDRDEFEDLTKLTAGVQFQPSQSVSAQVMFDLDRAKALDPDYTGKKWRGLAGDIETAAIYYRTGGLSLTLGRQRLFLGPQPVNLFVSATAEPMDLISAMYQHGRLDFSFTFARLDKSRPDSTDFERYPDESFEENRYLAVHRISLRLHRKFRLSLFESVTFGGEGRAPELYYLNPLQFFHTAQLNERFDDNTMLGFDFLFLPAPGWATYGQFLLDDIQVDNSVESDKEPAEIGIVAGVFRAGKVGTAIPDVRLEYTRITNRTYHQRKPRNRFLFRNELIGHPLGPDADSLSLLLRFWPSPRFKVDLETSYARHGEGRIYGPWDESFLEAEGEYSEPFPTGEVEKNLNLKIHLSGYPPLPGYWGRHFYLDAMAGYSDFSNRFNMTNFDDTVSWVDISLTWIDWFDLFIGDN